MRHLKARQRRSDGVWHYTSMNSKGAVPIGYCSPWAVCKACNGDGYISGVSCDACETSGTVRKKEPCPGHPTPEEAEQHYKEWLLDHAQFTDDLEEPKTKHQCDAPGCKVMTSGGVSIAGWYHKSLCPKHRHKETLDDMIEVGESWES